MWWLCGFAELIWLYVCGRGTPCVCVVADSAPPRRIIYFFEKWNGEITVVIKWSRWRFLLLPACSWSNSNLTALNSLFTHIKTRRVSEAYLGQQTREKKKSMNNKLNIFKEYNSSVNTTRLHFWATIILYWAITNNYPCRGFLFVALVCRCYFSSWFSFNSLVNQTPTTAKRRNENNLQKKHSLLVMHYIICQMFCLLNRDAIPNKS